MTLARSDWQLALSRFGYGARPGDGESRGGSEGRVASRTRGAPRRDRIENVELRSTPQILQDVYAYEARRKWSAKPPPWPRSRDRRCRRREVAALLFPASPTIPARNGAYP